jgi:hypothetical protein
MGEYNLYPIYLYVTHGVINWFQKSIHEQIQVLAHRTSGIGTEIHACTLDPAQNLSVERQIARKSGGIQRRQPNVETK